MTNSIDSKMGFAADRAFSTKPTSFDNKKLETVTITSNQSTKIASQSMDEAILQKLQLDAANGDAEAVYSLIWVSASLWK